MCVRWVATVRSPRKSAAATSRFVLPSATSVGDAALGRRSGPRRACGRRSDRARRAPSRPSRRRRAPRSRRAPPRSPRAPAASAARVAGRLRARAALGRGRTGSPTASCCATAVLERHSRVAISPRAAATSPRQRVACASTHSRPSRRASRLPVVQDARRPRRSDRARAAPRRSRARHQRSARLAPVRRIGGPLGGARTTSRPRRDLRSRARRVPRSRRGRRGVPFLLGEPAVARRASSRARSSSPRWSGDERRAGTCCCRRRLGRIARRSRAHSLRSAAARSQPARVQLDERQIPERLLGTALVPLAPLPIQRLEEVRVRARSRPTTMSTCRQNPRSCVPLLLVAARRGRAGRRAPRHQARPARRGRSGGGRASRASRREGRRRRAGRRARPPRAHDAPPTSRPCDQAPLRQARFWWSAACSAGCDAASTAPRPCSPTAPGDPRSRTGGPAPLRVRIPGDDARPRARGRSRVGRAPSPAASGRELPRCARRCRVAPARPPASRRARARRARLRRSAHRARSPCVPSPRASAASAASGPAAASAWCRARASGIVDPVGEAARALPPRRGRRLLVEHGGEQRVREADRALARARSRPSANAGSQRVAGEPAGRSAGHGRRRATGSPASPPAGRASRARTSASRPSGTGRGCVGSTSDPSARASSSA